MTWQVLFDAGAVAEVRGAFEEWRATREGPPLAEQQIRFDLIRSDDGELLRVLIDMDPLDEDNSLDSITRQGSGRVVGDCSWRAAGPEYVTGDPTPTTGDPTPTTGE